jgi:membrane-associated phospholipid phosphatase
MTGHRIVASLVLASAAAAPAPARADELSAPPRFKETEHFTVDPVVDGVLIAGGAGFAGMLQLVLSTGEIRPLPPGNPDNLLSIDRVAVTQTVDPHAGTYSDVGLYIGYGYALLDPILSGVRDGPRAALVDGVMYAESISLTLALTGITKIAVRRPRPVDYAKCGGVSTDVPGCESTDLQLSFFSGHASSMGAITATASYLAFVRSGWRRPRPWLTLGIGTALTAFVATERVRSGEHFPTDVVMGSLAGACIGVLVPHFHHRPHFHEKEYEAPPVWIGFAPRREGGGALTVDARF